MYCYYPICICIVELKVWTKHTVTLQIPSCKCLTDAGAALKPPLCSQGRALAGQGSMVWEGIMVQNYICNVISSSPYSPVVWLGRHMVFLTPVSGNEGQQSNLFQNLEEIPNRWCKASSCWKPGRSLCQNLLSQPLCLATWERHQAGPFAGKRGPHYPILLPLPGNLLLHAFKILLAESHWR